MKDNQTITMLKDLKAVVGREVSNNYSSTARARLISVRGNRASWVSVPSPYDPKCLLGGRSGEEFTTSISFAHSTFFC
jgi:hypothetical protein